MQAVFGTPWAIEETKLMAIVEFMNNAEFNHRALDHADECAGGSIVAAARMPQYQRIGSVAVLAVRDTIVPRANLMTAFSGGTSLDVFRQDFRAAVMDDDIDAVLLDFATPGGSVYQVPEMTDEIYTARERKPIIAQISTMAASAGYWLAASCNEINITPSGEVGSIGVIAMHVDWSKANEKSGIKPTYITAGKFKAEGNPNEPLSDDAHEFQKQRVNEYYTEFLVAVARGRGAGTEDVRENYGQGRMYGAAQALSVGMVDNISTMDQTLTRLKAFQPKRKSTARTMRARAEFPASIR